MAKLNTSTILIHICQSKIKIILNLYFIQKKAYLDLLFINPLLTIQIIRSKCSFPFAFI